MKQFTDFLTLMNKIMVPVGNYGIPRSSMPQIDSDLVPDFMEYLEDNEVELSFTKIRAHQLSLTQSEVNKMKVWKLMKIARKKKLNRIFVSRDGYVLDGSHRMVAALNVDRNYPVSVILVNLPILKLVKLAKRFNGVRFRNVSDAKLDPLSVKKELTTDRI